MQEKYYCPECKEELNRVSGCGSVSYFCDNCKKLVSRKNMLSEDEMKKDEKKN
ncbi:MAG: zinc ribbon domain-containing protein [Vallitalea sp.]|jgi:ribosomal protein L37AE/L43A|nr:zinc ribbon domain-containing protein [Vallitalea sp.]MCT4597720.1 zinc ribbon domain-containing protein [Vallitalea sp.]